MFSGNASSLQPLLGPTLCSSCLWVLLNGWNIYSAVRLSCSLFDKAGTVLGK